MKNCTQYNKQNIGKTFAFTILKEFALPHDTSKMYFVIADSNNCKFSIPKLNYQHYNLKPGNTIQCTLDRINCSGQLFFEPINPYYSINKSYSFNLIKICSNINFLGLEENIGIVIDIFGNEQWVHFLHQPIKLPSIIQVSVLFIKKGRLFLVPEDWALTHYLTSKPIKFKITGSIKTERLGEAFVLSDIFGNTHILPKANYKNYNLNEGSTLIGYIKGVSSKGFLYIEPQHQHYTLGTTYKFEVIEIIDTPSERTLFIEDVFGFMVKVVDEKKQYGIGSIITCLLSEINKGKLVLTLV